MSRFGYFFCFEVVKPLHLLLDMNVDSCFGIGFCQIVVKGFGENAAELPSLGLEKCSVSV